MQSHQTNTLTSRMCSLTLTGFTKHFDVQTVVLAPRLCREFKSRWGEQVPWVLRVAGAPTNPAAEGAVVEGAVERAGHLYSIGDSNHVGEILHSTAFTNQGTTGATDDTTPTIMLQSLRGMAHGMTQTQGSTFEKKVSWRC